MSAKDKTAIVLGTAALAFAAMTMVQPHLPDQPARTPQQLQQDRLDKDVADLSDADENRKGRLREEGNDLLEADRRDRLRPGERRPPKVPSFRFVIK